MYFIVSMFLKWFGWSTPSPSELENNLPCTPPVLHSVVVKPNGFNMYSPANAIKKMMDAMKPHNTIDLGDRIGSTSYIDFISVSELGDNNVVCGVDITKRPFFVLRGHIRYQLSPDTDFVTTPWMQTFFQRFSDNNVLWMGCGHGFKAHLFETSGGLSAYQAKILTELLTKQNVSVHVSDPLEARVYSIISALNSSTPVEPALIWLDSRATE